MLSLNGTLFFLNAEKRKDRSVTQFDFIGEDILSDDGDSDNEEQDSNVNSKNILTRIQEIPEWLKKREYITSESSSVQQLTGLSREGQLGLSIELCHYQNSSQLIKSRNLPIRGRD